MQLAAGTSSLNIYDKDNIFSSSDGEVEVDRHLNSLLPWIFKKIITFV